MKYCIEMDDLPTMNKQDVARSFSHAAATYDQVAILQRRVGETLLSKITHKPYQNIVDLGCGTGLFSERLSRRFIGSSVFGLDIAEGMLDFARARYTAQSLSWCCADAEQLPLLSGSVDLLFSSLAVQWCTNFQQVCDEIMRVLKPGGCCALATLGPKTLHELRTAWQQVDGYVHVNRFIDAPSVMHAGSQAGFVCQMWREDIVMRYAELRQLTAELKALGAHNVNSGRPKGLTGRQRMSRLKTSYESFRNSADLLPATYEVYYLLLEKSDD